MFYFHSQRPTPKHLAPAANRVRSPPAVKPVEDKQKYAYGVRFRVLEVLEFERKELLKDILSLSKL